MASRKGDVMTIHRKLLVISILLCAPNAAWADPLQSYAQKCDAAIGFTVPKFSCDAGTLVPMTNPHKTACNPANGDICDDKTPATKTACDRPNQLNRVCDPGSRFQTLVDTDKGFVVAHCRKEADGPGKYADIAVIQHSRVNGATCFYQALENQVGNVPLDGNVQPPSLGAGSPKFWMQPSDIAASGFKCGGCHDNGPIIRDPYLTQLTAKPNVLPGAGDDTFNADGDKYYFVGTEFAPWKAFKVEVPGNKCNDCHRLGVNNLLSGGTARDFAIRATARSLPNKNPHSAQSPMWMLKDQASFSQENADAAAAIKLCADKFTGSNISSPDCKITQISAPARGPTLGLGGQLGSDPSLGTNADGRLEVFARGADGTLHHAWQVDLAGGWSSWATLFGDVAGVPAIGRNADGRLEAFVRASDNSIQHVWQVAPNSDWSNWVSMGGAVNADPAVASNADGRLEVFVRGNDNALWHAWQTAANGEWFGWASLGGTLKGKPVVSINLDGRLEVFARGTDDALWHKWQMGPNGDWSDWASLGGNITTDPEIGINADGRMEVFVQGLDTAVWHIWQTEPSSGWSGWFSLNGAVAGGHAVGRNVDGGLEVYAIGADSAVWRTVQTSSGWEDWEQLGGEIINNLAVGRNADGRLEVFIRGPENDLWHNWFVAEWN
jgi:hypothetical protein